MRITLLFIVTLVFYSCNTDKNKHTTSFRHIIADTALSEKAKYELTFSRQTSEYLNLANIFNGVDSFELRIWSFGFWTRSDLFILRYSKNNWVSSNYIYHDNGKTINSLHLISKLVNQDSANKFATFLCADSTLKLPTQIDIPNFQDNTADGETYYIEISTKHFYKLLSYHNPQYFNDPANKQFIRLLERIKKNYKIYYPF